MTNRPKQNEFLNRPSPQKNIQATVAERRSASRHALVVNATAEELTSGVKLPARISDLSIYGCYLDTLNQFSPGTRIRIHLWKGNEAFQSLAVVIYSHEGLGMGIAFTDVNPVAGETVQKWLAEAAGGNALATPSNSLQNPFREAGEDRGKTGQVERLVQILINKGLLTQEEARGILN